MMHENTYTIAVAILIFLQTICICWWLIESHFLNHKIKWQEKTIQYYENENKVLKENLWTNSKTINETAQKRDKCFKSIIETIVNDYPDFKFGKLEKK
jgi:hypothetical protein